MNQENIKEFVEVKCKILPIPTSGGRKKDTNVPAQYSWPSLSTVYAQYRSYNPNTKLGRNKFRQEFEEVIGMEGVKRAQGYVYPVHIVSDISP